MQLDHFGMYPERAFMKVAGRMTFEGGGKGGSAPPAPDYTAAAQQTAAGNLATARIGQYGNMVNQYTPQGSVTYTPRTTGYINTSGQSITPEEYNARRTAGEDVTGFNPLEQWSQTVTLSPEQQQAYNEDIAMNARLRGVAGQGVDYVQQALNEPLQGPELLTDQLQNPNFIKSIPLSDFVRNVNIPELQTEVANAGEIQRKLERPTFDVVGNVQNNANQITTQAQDPNLIQQQVTDALYKQQTQYLDPQFQQSQSRLENQLANQGITRGSEAWNNAIQEQGRQKQQAYESARQSAIGQGVGAASTLYGNQLAGLQFGNQALGQQFGQNVTAAQLQNAANAQQMQNAMTMGQFTNQAQAQQYQQNLADLQAKNAALESKFGMGMSNAQLANEAAKQTFEQQLTNANLWNQLSQQEFGNLLSSQQQYNQTAQQQFANAQVLQQQPINILNAVRTGSQLQSVQQPQIGVSQPGQMATVSGPDYLSAATATGQYNQGLYNAQNASQSNMLGGLMGLAGTGMMAYGMGGGFK